MRRPKCDRKNAPPARKFCLTQSEAVDWIQKTRKSDDDIIIENVERPKDINCDPYPRKMTHYDRVFLAQIGSTLQALSYHDGWLSAEQYRRASGAPEREFAKQLKRHLDEFERQRKR